MPLESEFDPESRVLPCLVLKHSQGSQLVLFEGVCLNSCHPNPRHARKRESERQLRDHFAVIRWIRWIRWKRWRGKKWCFAQAKQ